MADRRGLLVPLLIITFIFLSPGPANGPVAPLQYRQVFDKAIEEEQHSLEVLQNSSYIPQRFANDQVYALNLTGFEADRGYAWGGLHRVQSRVRNKVEYALGESAFQALELQEFSDEQRPLYENVTGFVHGKWVRSSLLEANLSAPKLNLSDYTPEGPFGPIPPQPFDRNITGKHGEVRINFSERDPKRLPNSQEFGADVTDMELEMTLSDSDTTDEFELRLHGVYFHASGHALLTTTSDKFAGIFALPHLTLSQPMFNKSQALLNSSISRTIDRQLNSDMSTLSPWASHTIPSDPRWQTPQCELIVYLQQLPPTGLPFTSAKPFLHFLESELRFPTGVILPRAPALHFSMIAFSPDCGYILESEGPPDYAPQDHTNHLVGSKIEVLNLQGRRHLLFYTCTIGAQLVLLLRQMREASTPSTRSKISFYTIAMLSLGDGFTSMSFLMAALFVPGLSMNFLASGFIAFMSVSFFGMRLLMDIWGAQAPERLRRQREIWEEGREQRERITAAVERVRAARAEAMRLRVQVDAAMAAETPGAPPSAPPMQAQNAAEGQRETTGSEQADAVQPPTDTANSTDTAPPPLPVPGAFPPPNPSSNPPTGPRPPNPNISPVFMPSDQDGLYALEEFGDPNGPPTVATMPSFGALYTRFYLLLLGSLFLSLNALTWPYAFRRVFYLLVTLFYLSAWIPQLHRNVQRNCRRALTWEFVAGQSVLRLVPLAYFYAYEGNVLFVERDLASLAILALWVWVQVVALGSQAMLGPRWCIPKGWAPEAWEYHPVLRADEEGDLLPLGLSTPASSDGNDAAAPLLQESGVQQGADKKNDAAASSAPKKPALAGAMDAGTGKRVFDCAICMQDLEVPVIEADGAGSDAGAGTLGAAGLLARRAYMVTPCRHIFHSACLEGWMKFRLQCPNCRETLPPL